MTIITPPRRHRTHVTTVKGRWAIRVSDMPYRFGWGVQLVDGMAYRGPLLLMIFGVRYAWWWRPTLEGALDKGFKEASR